MNCDLQKIQRSTMKGAQEKSRRLREAGIPVSGKTFSTLLKESHREAVEGCEPLDTPTLTPEQMALVAEICQPCSEYYKVETQGG